MATRKVCNGIGKCKKWAERYVVTGCPPGHMESYETTEWCPACHGTGKTDGKERVWTETKRHNCPSCGGSGICREVVWDKYPDGCEIPGTRRTCKDKCRSCAGKGYYETTKRYWER